MDDALIKLTTQLQSLPVELTSLILLMICISSMLLLVKIFGKYGLYLYNIVAMLAANIQVLRGVQFIGSNHPIALGTVVFASTYLCSCILSEHYGKNAAQRSVGYSLAGQMLMMILMLIAIGHKPLSQARLSLRDYHHMLTAERAMGVIFIPSVRFLAASLISFMLAQWLGINIFQLLRRISRNKFLWIRTIFTLLLCNLADTCIFNLLAWKIFLTKPLSGSVIFNSYMLWSFITQIIIIVLSSPVVYLSYGFIPKKSIED